MATFALVSEGITDQVVIEHLIYGVVEDGDDEEVHFTRLQPLRDETDKARQQRESYGGWENVLEYCTKTEKLLEALSTNQYLVIQIDTDCCEHPAFGLSFHKDGAETPPIDLAIEARNVIIEKLSVDFYNRYQHRIIFAIAVHSTECWLLPFYGTTASAKVKTKSCEHKLTTELAKLDISFMKDHACFSKISKPLSKWKLINKNKNINLTLRTFLNDISSLAPYNANITEPETSA
jgi:hypothetical protein